MASSHGLQRANQPGVRRHLRQRFLRSDCGLVNRDRERPPLTCRSGYLRSHPGVGFYFRGWNRPITIGRAWGKTDDLQPGPLVHHRSHSSLAIKRQRSSRLTPRFSTRSSESRFSELLIPPLTRLLRRPEPAITFSYTSTKGRSLWLRTSVLFSLPIKASATLRTPSNAATPPWAQARRWA